MRDYTKFYINGAWVEPETTNTLAVENPAMSTPQWPRPRQPLKRLARPR